MVKESLVKKSLSVIERENLSPIEIELSGKVVPKARPRVTRKGTFMPQRYTEWRKEAARELERQGVPAIQIERSEIEISFIGKHNGNADLDNLAGAILDLLVGEQIIKDDRINCVSRLSVSYLESKESPSVMIRIIPIAPKTQTRKSRTKT